jgi:hypothetical protein
MKKFNAMRAAATLLVLTLITSCFVGGTFAKYTTSDEASDTARVAKWGVTVLASGSLFGEHYYSYSSTGTTSNTISASTTNSVDVSAAGTNIVAPGTKSDKGMTVSVSGTPEVANTVTVSTTANQTNSDIWLEAGTYATLVKAEGVTKENFKDYYVATTGDSSTTYAKVATNADFSADTTYYELHDETTVTAITISSDSSNTKYYPIKWTVATTDNTGNETKSNSTDCYTAAAVQTALGTLFNTGSSQNNANAKIDKTATITWEWPFETGTDDNAKKANNGADTILGNLIAYDSSSSNYVVVKTTNDGSTYTELTKDTDYSLNVSLYLTVSVTQVD